MAHETPVAFKPAATARRLNCGLTTVYSLMKSGELPYSAIGRMRLISEDDIRALLERTKVTKPALEPEPEPEAPPQPARGRRARRAGS